MPLQKFLIAPYGQGLTNDVKPWLIPDTSFEMLNNAYVFRGRMKKRFGSSYLNSTSNNLQSRLRVKIGTTTAGGALGAVILPTSIDFSVGQEFSIGTNIYIVTSLGAVAGIRQVAGTGTITFNTTTGSVSVAGALADTDVFFYPMSPVLGLVSVLDDSIGIRELYGFDQYLSYKYNITTSSFEYNSIVAINTGAWKGATTNYFTSAAFNNVDPDQDFLFVTNNAAFSDGVFSNTTQNGIKYIVEGASTFTNFSPVIRTNLNLTGAKIVLYYKSRLLVFAPWESVNTAGSFSAPKQIQNRVRYSWTDTITDTSNCFLERVGNGGYIDGPTAENIISVATIKDKIIVYFERSTWELASTGNPIAPFGWQRINSTIGSESTQGSINFDNVSLTIGNNGIYACNGVNMNRIDENIPDEVFKIKNIIGPTHRVSGIRDYFTELVYWTFPDAIRISGTVTQTYPNRILVYDYINRTWAFFDDSVTTWGYFEQTQGFRWSTWNKSWKNSNWRWDTPRNIQRFTRVIGGNAQGYIFQVDPSDSTNAAAMSVENMVAPNTITIKEHNLRPDEFIRIHGASGITSLNNVNVKVTNVVDKDTVKVDTFFTGTYTGAGVMERLSRIDMRFKQFGFFLSEGKKCSIPFIEFYVSRTSNGLLAFNYSTDSSVINLTQDNFFSGSSLINTQNQYLETSPYPTIPYEKSLDRFWHRLYLQAEGDVIQFRIFADDTVMRSGQAVDNWFELHAILIYATPEGTRF